MTREMRTYLRYRIDELSRERANREAARAGRPGHPIVVKPKRAK